MTRWQPASPSWASCSELAHGQRAVRAAQQLAQRGAGDEGLEAAAVAAAADRALGIDQDVADLAGDAARAAEGAAVDDEARRRCPPTGADRPSRGVPRPTPKVDSPSAPTLASLSRWTGSPRRSSISAAGSSADPAGQDRLRVHEAASRGRSGRAGPCPRRGRGRARRRPRRSAPTRASRRCRARPRRRCRPRAPRRTRRGSCRTGRRRRRAGESWPKSRPTTAPAERSRATSTGGRPPCEPVAATPSVARSMTIPAPGGRRRGSTPSSGSGPSDGRCRRG